MTTIETARSLLRATMKRGDHATLVLPERDPVAILEEQHASRLTDLVPVRIGRMLQSPFTYYRGTAAVMAHDLANAPVTGVPVVSCGDAHISNFGLYASPERRLLFDLNDFDEGGLAPWEWDVKRLAASVVVGGRDSGFADSVNRDAAEFAVGEYRRTLAHLMELSALERYFYQVETDWLESTLDRDGRKMLKSTAARARTRTSDQVLRKIVVRDLNGQPTMVDQPPVAQHVEHGTTVDLELLIDQYRHTLRADVALLLSQFTFKDYILRIVGVGSVGTRCYVLLFEGPAGEPLFLQAKEAPASVLETYGKRTPTLPEAIPPVSKGHQGYRVVSVQRVLQAQSDPFLGWIEGYAGDNRARQSVDYYLRQFRDMKGSVELGLLTPRQYERYVGLCGQLLARAHAQSATAGLITTYLGDSDRFDRAVATWSVAYADQAERDFETLQAAVASGRIPAEYGV